MIETGTTEVHALRGASLHVDSGEALAIRGRQARTSRLLMNITGCRDQPTSGTYRLDGMEVSQPYRNQLAEIRSLKLGFVFFICNLLPRLTAIGGGAPLCSTRSCWALTPISKGASSKIGLNPYLPAHLW